jgi:hypothetical protein
MGAREVVVFDRGEAIRFLADGTRAAGARRVMRQHRKTPPATAGAWRSAHVSGRVPRKEEQPQKLYEGLQCPLPHPFDVGRGRK